MFYMGKPQDCQTRLRDSDGWESEQEVDKERGRKLVISREKWLLVGLLCSWDVELPTFKNSMDYVSAQNVRERGRKNVGDTLVKT